MKSLQHRSGAGHFKTPCMLYIASQVSSALDSLDGPCFGGLMLKTLAAHGSFHDEDMLRYAKVM